MTEAILGTLAMVLCVIGAVSIIRGIALRLSVDKNASRIYAVVLGKEPDIQLQMLMESVEWDWALKHAKILAIDGGLNDEKVDYCRTVCKNSGIKFIEHNEAEGLLMLFNKI